TTAFLSDNSCSACSLPRKSRRVKSAMVRPTGGAAGGRGSGLFVCRLSFPEIRSESRDDMGRLAGTQVIRRAITKRHVRRTTAVGRDIALPFRHDLSYPARHRARYDKSYNRLLRPGHDLGHPFHFQPLAVGQEGPAVPNSQESGTLDAARPGELIVGLVGEN